VCVPEITAAGGRGGVEEVEEVLTSYRVTADSG